VGQVPAGDDFAGVGHRGGIAREGADLARSLSLIDSP
jgi:hypothetical protein